MGPLVSSVLTASSSSSLWSFGRSSVAALWSCWRSFRPLRLLWCSGSVGSLCVEGLLGFARRVWRGCWGLFGCWVRGLCPCVLAAWWWSCGAVVLVRGVFSFSSLVCWVFLAGGLGRELGVSLCLLVPVFCCPVFLQRGRGGFLFQQSLVELLQGQRQCRVECKSLCLSSGTGP